MEDVAEDDEESVDEMDDASSLEDGQSDTAIEEGPRSEGLSITAMDEAEEVHSRAPPMEEAPNERKRHRSLEPDIPDSMRLAEGERARRTRKVVSYAEVNNVNGGYMRLGDHIVAALEAAGAVHRQDQSDASAVGSSPGIDLLAITERVKECITSGQKHHKYQKVRSSLAGLLKSGRVRRRLVPAVRGRQGDTEAALRLLVVSSMQIDPDPHAPWTLSALDGDHASLNDASNSVWDTDALAPSLHTHDHRGEALVGRQVEVWWDGDAMFHLATVLAYNTVDILPRGCTEPRARIPARTHTLEYEADGLRTIEDLDGTGEPALWRIVAAPSGGGTREDGALADGASADGTPHAAEVCCEPDARAVSCAQRARDRCQCSG